VSLVGEIAPEFSMKAVDGQSLDAVVEPKRYAGRWLVLFFYPADFTFVCPTELRAVSARRNEVLERDADVAFVSTDSVYSHKAWMDAPADMGGVGHLTFPMASDPTHSVSRAFGVLDEASGQSQRATVIIDPEGRVRYSLVHDDRIGRSVDELLRVLDALRTGERCPVDWRRGEAVLSA